MHTLYTVDVHVRFSISQPTNQSINHLLIKTRRDVAVKRLLVTFQRQVAKSERYSLDPSNNMLFNTNFTFGIKLYTIKKYNDKSNI
jgi:hypothetical protein